MAIRQVARDGASSFWIAGELAEAPGADSFAAEVASLLHRYATEVVAAYGLCPFLHNVDNGLGAVCIVLDREPRVDEAVSAIQATKSSVVHLAYPLVPRQQGEPTKPTLTSASRFERFGNSVAEGLRRVRTDALVHATFHPELVGGTENPHRMVGLLRRSPDAFIQFIPPGMHEGGTVIAGAVPPSISPLQATYARVVTKGALTEIDRILAELHELQRSRDARFNATFFAN